MYTRISSTLVLLALAGCGEGETTDGAAAAPQATAAAAQADGAGRVPCAEHGAALARTCTVEREEGDHGLILTLRHPDGGFRRLLVTRDGRGVVAADGAERARVRVLGSDRIEVKLGDARYQLPATVKAGAR